MPDTTDPSSFATTDRSRVHRQAKRAHYDRETIFEILDSSLLCHVGYIVDGQPYVTPTAFWRDGEVLYWHGSSVSRMLRLQAEGIPVCLTVSHIDGLVVARSAFRMSLNYRSCMVFGRAKAVADPAAHEAGLNAFVERLYPNRTRLMRPILSQEVQATKLMSMVIEEASAKTRDDGPADLETDYGADCWAGAIRIMQRVGVAIPDTKVPPRGSAAREIGHFAEGVALDQLLLMLARREGR